MRWILFFILITSFFVRISFFNNPEYAEDTNRDYMIARHALIYNENVSNILFDNGHNEPINSPVYLGTIIGLVAISDNIYFLGMINIIGQIFTIACLYILTSKLFNKPSGIITSFLYAVSVISIHQSTFFWHPRLMQPILYTSFVFFVFAYMNQTRRHLYIGLALYSLSAAVYKGAFSFLPIIVVITLMVLQKTRSSFRAYLYTFIIFILSIIALYWKPLMYILIHPFERTLIPDMFSISDALEEFVNAIFNVNPKRLLLIPVVIFCSSILSIVYSYITNKNLAIRKIIIFLSLVIIWSIFISGIVAAEPLAFLRYVAPAYGLFIILISQAIWCVWQKYTLSRIALVAYTLVVVSVLSDDSYIFSQIYEIPNQMSTLTNRKPEFVDPIIRELRAIQQKKHYDTLGFFQVRSYNHGERYEHADAVIYAPLEKHTGEAFVRLTDSTSLHYEPTTKDDYMIVLCYLPTPPEKTSCLNTFLEQNSAYDMKKELFADQSVTIFLAERIHK